MGMDPRFRQHLAATFNLEEAACERLVAEVLDHHGQTLAEFVRLRHGELKRRGLKNEDIYQAILAEAAERRFAAEPLSVRQLRRIIYG